MAKKQHEYEADRQSGAGNCCCGWSFESVRHPHPYRKAAYSQNRCVCGELESHITHEVTS